MSRELGLCIPCACWTGQNKDGFAYMVGVNLLSLVPFSSWWLAFFIALPKQCMLECVHCLGKNVIIILLHT
jgi:hypothetical protein